MYGWVTWNHITQWTQGQSSTPNDFLVGNISTDSRTLKPKEIFTALRGENFDGHDYVNDVIARGASGLIVEKSFPDAKIPQLIVKDTLRAMIDIAKALRENFKGEVIAITGSAGKSSTKEMTHTLLGPHTIASPASFNNLLGVSKTLFLVRDDTRFIVLEMGTNAPGEIQELCKTFQPTIGLITNIGTAHLGRLGGIQGVTKEKRSMFEHLTENHGKIVVNIDDPMLESFNLSKKFSTYSVKKDASVRVQRVSVDTVTFATLLDITIGKERLEVTLPIFGLHHAQNFAAATSLAVVCGVTPSEIKARWVNIRAAKHRGEVIHHTNFTLVDESYNSNPSALKASLETLFSLPRDRRKVLVLGAMYELEGYEVDCHTQMGTYLAEKLSLEKDAVVVGIGKLTAHMLSSLENKTLHFDTAKEGTEPILSLLKPRDLLFIKGSRGVGLDGIVSAALRRA